MKPKIEFTKFRNGKVGRPERHSKVMADGVHVGYLDALRGSYRFWVIARYRVPGERHWIGRPVRPGEHKLSALKSAKETVAYNLINDLGILWTGLGEET